MVSLLEKPDLLGGASRGGGRLKGRSPWKMDTSAYDCRRHIYRPPAWSQGLLSGAEDIGRAGCPLGGTQQNAGDGTYKR